MLAGNWGRYDAKSDRKVDNSQWNAFLGRYVVTGSDGVNRVAYARAAKTNTRMLRPYITSLEKIDPASLNKDEQMAFWINLYNAVTADLILQNPGIKSIRDLGIFTLGPWNKDLVRINNSALSLNDIEHGILRPIWKDVRIHYAVNCASIGCPNLALRAYSGEELEDMLQQAAADFINHPRGFTQKEGKIQASRIFDWYGSDWGDVKSILNHARLYAKGDAAAMLANANGIDSYDYDWKLNAVE